MRPGSFVARAERTGAPTCDFTQTRGIDVPIGPPVQGHYGHL